MNFILLFLPFVLCSFNDSMVTFLSKNTLQSGLPLSYMLYPKNYFDTVPENLKPHDHTAPAMSITCNEIVSAQAWNDYEFQTEQLLTALGLNIYDGAIWSIALSSQGMVAPASNYYSNVLLAGKSLQLANLRGDAPCKGVLNWGQCTDPKESGICGFCYGDKTVTVAHNNAYFFRMISDYWAVEGTTLALCPDKKLLWTWNDWKPVLGENAWANYLGALTTVYYRVGKNVQAIPDSSPEMQLATTMLSTLQLMVAGSSGGVHYTPYNTYFDGDDNAGATVSTENNASLYAGLKALLWILQQNPSSQYANLIPAIQTLMDGIKKYLQSAYDPTQGYFRQGGSYDPRTQTWTWGQGTSPSFAVDCQTWVGSVLGSDLIDSWFGAGTSYKLWQTTKQLGGYGAQPDGKVKGVGFTFNQNDQVFSGEWTYGAINWLRIMASDSNYSADQKATLTAEADFMYQSIANELYTTVTFADGTTGSAVLYSNKRYFIPFGWWANPLPATSSTGWHALVTNNLNPFLITGAYKQNY
eukprot:NODE_2136_length_1675_cov_52.047680_g1825_i0.p1 GENE.NODE_2136_length_1675_cov_52.047680_g1825_i0~~NODE_2136_length_1675_cov_52.047680_g1825_i0.p1  ORF type:complete len:526 (+),score=90.48 NODE_2136_length_1675_cov_52.047680_g1825_i0:54-1631(+)